MAEGGDRGDGGGNGGVERALVGIGEVFPIVTEYRDSNQFGLCIIVKKTMFLCVRVCACVCVFVFLCFCVFVFLCVLCVLCI